MSGRSMRWRPRANLILYLSKAPPALEQVSADVQRTPGGRRRASRLFRENEVRWRSQAWPGGPGRRCSAPRCRACARRARPNKWPSSATKRALDEAEVKLKVVKQWTRVFDNRVDPLVKQMEKLHTVLAHDMVQAVAFLAQAITTLDAYAGVPPPPETAPGTAPAANPGREARGEHHEGKQQQVVGHHQRTLGPVAGYQELLERRQKLRN